MCLLLMIYEINHIFFMCLFLDETEAKGPQFFFLRLGPPCLRDWMTSTPLPPPPSNPLLWRSGSATESLLAG